MHLPRFEQISALKHHCGICKTPFSNPSALSTCVGKHEVICANYHFMFHFVGKAHTCKACINTEQQQEKRHRAILVMLQEYRKENGEEDAEHVEGANSPMASPHSDGLKKKDRKAQKKAAKSLLKINIIKQADLAELHAIIYPTDDNTEDADRVLSDALSVKCLPNILNEKRMLDTLMAPPKLKPNQDTEADRVIAACEVSEPQSKTARVMLEKIRTAIKEDIDIQWKTEFEMKKRRIIYAQWITQGAVDHMALHYEDWDINTGARMNRRYKGEERGAKGQNEIFEDYLDDFDDARSDITTDFMRRIELHIGSDLDSPTRTSPLLETDINVEKKSPLNDRRRGGNILHSNSPMLESPQAWDDENYLTTPKATAPVLRIVAPSTKRRESSPWVNLVKPKPLDLSVQPPNTPSPTRRQSMPAHIPQSHSSPAAASTPRGVWNRASLSHIIEHTPTTRPDGAVIDMLESSPPPKMAHTIRVIPKQVPVDTFVDEEHGDWATVGKKGKPRPMNIGRLRK